MRHMGRRSMVFDRQRMAESRRRWLDQYNPLRGLTMDRLGRIFDQMSQGDYIEGQWLNRLIERRDAVVLALKRRRRAAQRRLRWSVKRVTDRPRGHSEAEAEEQRMYLEGCYNKIANLNEALEWLMLADFRGFAHLERLTDREGHLVELQPVPQYHFTRDGIYGDWRFHLEPMPGNRLGGDALEPGKWIVREVSDPSYEIFAIAFLRKTLGLLDWDGFMETYGIPWFFLVMPPGVAPELEAEYYETAERVAADGRGVLPNGTTVETADAGLRGQNPFTDYLREQCEQQVLVGTGGLLTMLTAAGSGTLAGGAHLEAWREIVSGEAQTVAEMMREEHDLPCLRKRFGEDVVRLAFFDLSEPQENDPDKFVTRVSQLALAGYQVETEAVAEGAGVPLAGSVADEEDEDLTRRHEGTKKAPGLANTRVAETVEALVLAETTLAAVLGAQREFLAPVRARLMTTIERVLARDEPVVTVDEARTLIEELERELGDLIVSGPEGDEQALEGMTRALESGLGEAAVLGLREALRERRKMEREMETL